MYLELVKIPVLGNSNEKGRAVSHSENLKAASRREIRLAKSSPGLRYALCLKLLQRPPSLAPLVERVHCVGGPRRAVQIRCVRALASGARLRMSAGVRVASS